MTLSSPPAEIPRQVALMHTSKEHGLGSANERSILCSADLSRGFFSLTLLKHFLHEQELSVSRILICNPVTFSLLIAFCTCSSSIRCSKERRLEI